MSKISRQAEEKGREFLNARYGRDFKERKIEICNNFSHKFDASSEDEEIVGEVKSNSVGKSDRYKNAVKQAFALDLLLLEKCDAKHKYMILFCEKYFEHVESDLAKLCNNITFILLCNNGELRREIKAKKCK